MTRHLIRSSPGSELLQRPGHLLPLHQPGLDAAAGVLHLPPAPLRPRLQRRGGRGHQEQGPPQHHLRPRQPGPVTRAQHPAVVVITQLVIYLSKLSGQ